MIIGIHALQALGPNALNRDENGFPKTMVQGEARRGRISSQAQKRSLRTWAEKKSPEQKGIRTIHFRNRLFLPRLRKMLPKDQYSEDELVIISDRVITAFAGKLDAKGKLAAAIFTWPGEVDLLVTLSIDHVSDLLSDERGDRTAKQIAEKIVKKNLKKPFSIAAFGRMIAKLPEGNIDGALAFSHAITTHDVFLNVDNFTAIDDLSKEEEANSFHLNEQPFLAPSTFYRHFSIDTILLQDHLGSLEKTKEAVELILEAFWHSVPSGGKQRSFKADEKPQFVLASVGGDGTSKGAAFIAPVRDNWDILGASIRQFDDAWRRTEIMRQRSANETIFTTTGYPEALNHLTETLVSGGYDELIDKVVSELER